MISQNSVVEAPKLEHQVGILHQKKVWISLNLKNHKIGQNSTKLNWDLLRPLETIRLYLPSDLTCDQAAPPASRPQAAGRLLPKNVLDLRKVHWRALIFYGFYMILYDFIWFYMILYDFIWFYMILYDFIWFYMILYDFIWFYIWIYDFLKNECQSQITANFTIKPSAGQKILPLWQQCDFQWVCHRSAWSESNMRQSEHLQQASFG